MKSPCYPHTCRETQEWISGQKPTPEPEFLAGRSAVVWAREYSTEDARRCDCSALQQALSKIPGAKRMVFLLSPFIGGIC